MPKLTENTVPSYRLHKQSGQAVVTLTGRDFLLGRHGTAASKAEYRRRIGEWIANGRQLTQDRSDLTVCELIAAFKVHAESYYRRPDGRQSDEVNNFRAAVRPLRLLYGHMAAREFGPLALQAVRNEMIHKGWCRTYINHQIARIKIVFKWAASQELIPASVHQALTTVSGLRRGRSDAVESEPVEPVSAEVVKATLPHLSSVVAAMVQVQLLTGTRPGEVCQMRTAEIDTSGPVWIYQPCRHKTAHHGKKRMIHIGPKAQEILRPFLKPLNAQAYVFSPRETEAERRQLQHERRKTPLSCGNVPGSNRKRRPRRQPGEVYDASSYRRAIARACEAAFPQPKEFAQDPQQLRHGGENIIGILINSGTRPPP
jgi:integrase